MTKQTYIHYKETPYGFEWGSAKIERGFSNKNKGWIILLLETPKHKGTAQLQIYVTKTGKVVVSSSTKRYEIK